MRRGTALKDCQAALGDLVVRVTTPRRPTAAEWQTVVDNMGLVWDFVNRNRRTLAVIGVSDDDAWALWVVSLARAVIAHDPAKARLSTLFATVAWRDLSRDRRTGCGVGLIPIPAGAPRQAVPVVLFGDAAEEMAGDGEHDWVDRFDHEAAVAPLLGALDENNRAIVEEHYGLAGHPGMTLEQLGRKYGVTRQAVNDRVRRSVLKMKLEAVRLGLVRRNDVMTPAQLRDEFVRADQACVCGDCGLAYVDHPLDSETDGDNGLPFLHVLCDGTRVKL